MHNCWDWCNRFKSPEVLEELENLRWITQSERESLDRLVIKKFDVIESWLVRINKKIRQPLFFECELVKNALYLVSRGHYKQFRKEWNEPYINHPLRVLKYYLDFLWIFFQERPPNHDVFGSTFRLDITEDVVILLLHDYLEDFIDNIKAPVDDRQALFQKHYEFIAKNFDRAWAIKISDTLRYWLTKASKRPELALLFKDLDDLMVRRLNNYAFLVCLVERLKNPQILVLKYCDSMHNNETLKKMKNSRKKAFEVGNLAIFCFSAWFRYLGNNLMRNVIFLLNRDDTRDVQPYDDFEKWVCRRREEEAQFMKPYRLRIKRAVADLLGHENFELSTFKIPYWRVFMDVSKKYWKIYHPNKQTSKWSFLLSQWIEDIGRFFEILDYTQVSVTRVVVTNWDLNQMTEGHAKDFEEFWDWHALGDFVIKKPVWHIKWDYAGLEISENNLEATWYEAIKFNLVVKETEGVRFKVKLVTRDQEVGNRFWISFFERGRLQFELHGLEALLRRLKGDIFTENKLLEISHETDRVFWAVTWESVDDIQAPVDIQKELVRFNDCLMGRIPYSNDINTARILDFINDSVERLDLDEFI